MKALASTNRDKRAVRALNRLTLACLDEQVALEPAARHMGGERAVRLRQQATRRAAFVQDLSAAVVALGGVPRRGASYGAHLAAVFRGVRELATDTNQGDDYAACAAASAKTANAYVETLRLDLPDAARIDIERQYADIDFDNTDLRRMRWGASTSRVATTDGAASDTSAPAAP
jgi:uncharacterized protein (TIGR02284 family)